MPTTLNALSPLLANPGRESAFSAASGLFPSVDRGSNRPSFADALTESRARQSHSSQRKSSEKPQANDAPKRKDRAGDARHEAAGAAQQETQAAKADKQNPPEPSTHGATADSPATGADLSPEAGNETAPTSQPRQSDGEAAIAQATIARSAPLAAFAAETIAPPIDPAAAAPQTATASGDASKVIAPPPAHNESQATRASARATLQASNSAINGAPSADDEAAQSGHVNDQSTVRRSPVELSVDRPSSNVPAAPDDSSNHPQSRPVDANAGRAAADAAPVEVDPRNRQRQQQGAARSAAVAAGSVDRSAAAKAARTDASPRPSDRAESANAAQQPSTADRILDVKLASAADAPSDARAARINEAVQLAQSVGASGLADGGAAQGLDANRSTTAPATNAASFAHVLDSDAGVDQAMRNAADDAKSTERVVRGLSTLVNQHGGAMKMRLHPPELGDLRVQMSVVRGVVTAQFQAATPEAHAMLERNMSVLRSALEQQGLTVERLAVQPQAPSNSQSMSQERNDQSQQNSQRHDAGDGRSRGHDGDARQRESHRGGERFDFRAFTEDIIEHSPATAIAGGI